MRTLLMTLAALCFALPVHAQEEEEVQARPAPTARPDGHAGKGKAKAVKAAKGKAAKAKTKATAADDAAGGAEAARHNRKRPGGTLKPEDRKK
ncbi:MAG: hypothetical protein KC613_23695 [Myxococcales bacterium]|nr:hypothetical protein [Myxococcales bacterium]MCB9523217.1 hypothetical protein [Myxococcales bacterium]